MKRNSIFSIAAIVALFFASCAPDNVTDPTPNSLVVRNGGVIKDSTRLWTIALSCGCAFPMKVVNADTTNLVYDLRDIPDTVSQHYIRVYARSKTLPSGTYTGWVALVTAPPTIEVFRDTLRDTLIVP